MRSIITILNWLLVLSIVSAQKPVLTLGTLHTSRISSISFSPDGNLMMTCSDDKAIKIWDIAAGKLIRTIHSAEASKACNFLSGGKYGVYDMVFYLNVFELSTGKIIKELRGGMIWCHKASPMSDQVITGHPQGNICLWDISTGKIKLSWKGHSADVEAIDWSSNGRLIASGSDDKTIKVWDALSGSLKFTLSGHSMTVRTLQISSDSKFLVSGSWDKTIKIWDLSSGQEICTLQGHTHSVNSVAISPDGKYVVSTSSDKTVRLWNIQQRTEVSYFSANNIDCSIARFTPDGKHIVCGTQSGKFLFWEVSSAKQTNLIDAGKEKLSEAEVLPDMQTLVVKLPDSKISAKDLFNPAMETPITINSNASQEAKVLSTGKSTLFGYKNQIFELSSGRQLFNPWGWKFSDFSFSHDRSHVLMLPNNKSVAVLHDLTNGETKTLTAIESLLKGMSRGPGFKWSYEGKYVLLQEQNQPKVILLNMLSGEILLSFNSAEDSYELGSMEFAPDGRHLVTGSEDKLVKIWDLRSKRVVRTMPGHKSRVLWVCYSPDGSNIASASSEDIRTWDASTGKLLNVFPNNCCNVSYLPDGDYLFSNATNMGYYHAFKILKCSDKALKYTCENEGMELASVGVSSDMTLLIEKYKDRSIQFRNLANGKVKATLYLIDEGKEWVVTTPDGYFDGTADAIKKLYYVNGMVIFPLETLYEQFYTPGLLRKTLNGNAPATTTLEGVELTPPPVVRFVLPLADSIVTSQEVTITVSIDDFGKGIDEIRLFHNGKMTEGTARGFKSLHQKEPKLLKSFTISLVNGENIIRVTALNFQRTESLPVERKIIFKGTPVTANLYLLAIGISNYLNPRYNLSYAEKDAMAVADVLEGGAKGIFGLINISLLKNSNATKAEVLNQIQLIASRAKPEDVFVFYFAGHGVMSNGNTHLQPDFYMIPYDVTKMYEADDMLREKGISAAEIRDFSRVVKAQKQLFILDACQSGGAMQSFALRGASEEKAIAQLARSTGTFFIAASGSDQYATEVNEIGHGIFTYSLIEGLKGSCKSNDGKITVNLLKSCIEETVPEITRKFHGQPQYPTGYGFGQDFPIALIKKGN